MTSRFSLLFVAALGLSSCSCVDDPVRFDPYRPTPGDAGSAPPPPGCGDGIVDSGEACDDGNQDNLDACSNRCTANPPAARFIAHPRVDAVAGSRQITRDGSGRAVVDPLVPVRLSGEDSEVPDGEVRAFQWSLEAEHGASRPEGSNVRLDVTDRAKVRLQYQPSSGAEPGVDLAGEYRVALRVQAPDGRWSAWQRVALVAKPSRNLWVEMDWNVDAHDVDLHLLRGAEPSNYTTDQDCYYANCLPDSPGQAVLSWGGRAAGDDPILDVDDIDGLGPEVISIPVPEMAQKYLVAVHLFRKDLSPTAEVRVRILIDGEVAFSASRDMLDGDEWWEVATVDWASGEVERVDRYRGAPP
jgi:cysteine-rich repeat protein